MIIGMKIAAKMSKKLMQKDQGGSKMAARVLSAVWAQYTGCQCTVYSILPYQYTLYCSGLQLKTT